MSKAHFAFILRDWDDNIGIMLISALLKRHGHSSEIIMEAKNTAAEIAAKAPDVVGYSCITGQQNDVLASIRTLRAAGYKGLVIVGGPHPTFYPDFIKNAELDAICRGEGEYAMLDLAESISDGKNPHDIENLSWNLGGEILENPLRPLVEDLDSLPLPDRSHYDRYPFLASNPYKIFITGRGCPFKCTFCFNHALHAMYGRTALYIRRRSPGNVIEELRQVHQKWGIGEIRFSDDHFCMDVDWLREFVPMFKAEIGRPFTVNARVDVLDEEKISLLADAGCRLLCFGVETGREALRNKVLKKKITDKQIFTAAALLDKYGIRFLTSNIIGLPGETPEDAWQTIEINQKIKTHLPWYSMMQYYPGTKIHADAVAAGIIPENFNPDFITDYFNNNYMRSEHMDELQNIHSLAILTSWLPRLTPLAKRVAKGRRNKTALKLLFKMTYLLLSSRRANLSFRRIITGLPRYLKKI